MATSTISTIAVEANKGQMHEELNDFLASLDHYKPTIPDAVSRYYLESCGGKILDNRVLKLICLATDKFVAEIIYEAKEQALLKIKNPKNKRKLSQSSIDSIDIYDLEGSLSQFNIFWRRSLRQKLSKANG